MLPPALFSKHARALADYMSSISENAYCAGWMHEFLEKVVPR